MTKAAVILLAASAAAAQPGHDPTAPPLDYRTLEAPFLTGHVQLTSRDQFVKAGEAYFSPGDDWIIFQAVPVPEAGRAPDDFYSMYVAKVTRDADNAVSGIEKPILVSPPGSWNSCGWFHPKVPGTILFGSTIKPPSTEQKSGFQVGTRKYVWLFPEETDIVMTVVPEIFTDIAGKPFPLGAEDEARALVPVFELPDYQAECALSRDGRFLVYATVRPERTDGRPDADIWIYDINTKKHHPIIVTDGYDGGPFFSPDGKRICYRSDRKLNDELQLFVADLRFEDGVPVGIEHEHQLTFNDAVNWAPFWHPSGKFLVYGTSQIGHFNYEVFAVETDTSGAVDRVLRRVTFADGADVLPVFSNDGRTMMWTCQRGPMVEGEQKPSSQLWAARVQLAPSGPGFSRETPAPSGK